MRIRGCCQRYCKIVFSPLLLTIPQSIDIIDLEAHETENLLSRQPHLAQTRVPSHIANNHLIAAAGQYDATIKQAASSDATVKAKWQEWSSMIGIIAGGEVRIPN